MSVSELAMAVFKACFAVRGVVVMRQVDCIIMIMLCADETDWTTTERSRAYILVWTEPTYTTIVRQMLVYTSNSDAQLEASSDNQCLPIESQNDVEASRFKLQRTDQLLFCTTLPRFTPESCIRQRQGSEALQYEQRPGLDSECIALTLTRTI